MTADSAPLEAIAAEDLSREPNVYFRNPEVTIREETEEDGRFLLYEPQREALLVMNPTGKAILELCDGHRTAHEIVEELKKGFETPPDIDMQEEVERYLAILLKTNIVFAV
jgi:pyrroloquinoline quinone biosynthesis protein D